MPTYEYKCAACGHAFEAFQSIKADRIRKCPECGKMKVDRLLSAGAGMIFKGSGFYITDYRSEGYKSDAKADAPGESKPSDGKGGEGKPPDSKASEARTSEAKSSEAKTSEAKSSESKPSDSKHSDAKPSESKPSDVRSSDSRPARAETKPTPKAGAPQTEPKSKKRS